MMKPNTDAFFSSERRPLSRKTAWLLICNYGRLAGLPVEAHPHMLRHACGYALADQGADTRLIRTISDTGTSNTLSATPQPTPRGSNGSGVS